MKNPFHVFIVFCLLFTLLSFTFLWLRSNRTKNQWDLTPSEIEGALNCQNRLMMFQFKQHCIDAEDLNSGCHYQMIDGIPVCLSGKRGHAISEVGFPFKDWE